MKASRFNDFLQIGGILGVIIGLVLVAYEIRETNRVAFEQIAYESTSAFTEWEKMWADPYVAQVLVKVAENEEPLTRQEMYVYDSFLTVWMEAYVAAYGIAQSSRASFEVLEFMAVEAPQRFDNPTAREWYKVNRWLFPEELANVIDQALVDAPMGITLGEMDRIRLKGGTNR